MIDLLSSLLSTAKSLFFDNTGSTLTSTNVEDAIKELDSSITAENTWDRDTTGDPFLTQHNLGDDIIAKDLGNNQVAKLDVSQATLEVRRAGENDVAEYYDSTNTIQAKINTNGDSFLKQPLVLGGETSNALFTLIGSLSFKMTDAGAANYNPSALTEDLMITANNTAASRNIIISTEDIQKGTPTQPRIFIVTDYYGSAGTYNLVISGESGNINGGASVSIVNNYNSLWIYSDGTNLRTF